MCAGKTDDDEPFPAWDEQVIKRALENIYHKKINVKTDIEPNLFEATWQTLNLAIDKGFGKIEYNHPDADFVYELRHNAGLFAAFKVHRQQNDMAARLADDNGQVKPFSQWVKDVQPIASHYNRNWLQTEYSTAIMRARQAAQWRKYERNADLFPNLKWLPSTSIDKREGHVPFYGLVKPIDDPFWKMHYPGNLWNCKCGITNTDDKPADYTPTAPYKPAPGLDANPATGQLYNVNTHPYKTRAYEGAAQAVKNAVNRAFNARIKEVLNEYKKSLPQHGGKLVESENLATGSMIILRKSVKTIANHNEDWHVKIHLIGIERKVKKYEYLGWAKTEKNKHKEADYFLYYKVRIAGKDRYVNMMFHKELKKEVPYAILDKIEISNLRKGLPDI